MFLYFCVGILRTCPSANVRFPNGGVKSSRLAVAAEASQYSVTDPNRPAFRKTGSFKTLFGGGTS